MIINAFWNNYNGPGGRTQHLHNGDELGSTCKVKRIVFIRSDTTVRVRKILNANKNASSVKTSVANDNYVMQLPIAAAA